MCKGIIVATAFTVVINPVAASLQRSDNPQPCVNYQAGCPEQYDIPVHSGQRGSAQNSRVDQFSTSSASPSIEYVNFQVGPGPLGGGWVHFMQPSYRMELKV